MTQSKEKNKSPEIDSKEREVHKLPDKKLKIAITIKIHSERRKSMNEQNESNDQDTENIKTAKQKFYFLKLILKAYWGKKCLCHCFSQSVN